MLLPQRYPFRIVDRVEYDETTGLYNGYKNFSDNRHTLLKTLIAEGMGQTVEYNIRNLYKLEKEKILLGRIECLEFIDDFSYVISFLFKVENLRRCNSFFISEVKAFDKDQPENKIAKIKIVHVLV